MALQRYVLISRCAIGGALADYMPIPDAVITTTNLCEISGRKFDIDKLRAAVRLSNEARKYIIKSNELRMTNPSPFSRFDGLAYILVLTASQGLREGVEIYKTLASEL